MAGNVWEWTSDWYVPRLAEDLVKSCCTPANPHVTSPDASYDPLQPNVRIPRKVTEGGSHLCAPNYCFRYRPAARSPEAIDTATCHIGFRCIPDDRGDLIGATRRDPDFEVAAPGRHPEREVVCLQLAGFERPVSRRQRHPGCLGGHPLE